MASSLYHPDTVERSLKHDGSGDEPGLKDPDGNWDLRPHRKRIINVTDETLQIWHAVMEDDSVPVRQTRMVYTVNSTAADVLATLSRQPRAGALDLQFSRGWDESRDRKKGYFESRWGVPQSWNDVILQGPHLYVGDPDVQVTEPDDEDTIRTGQRPILRRSQPTPSLLPLTNRPEAAPVRCGLHAVGVRARPGLLPCRMASNGSEYGRTDADSRSYPAGRLTHIRRLLRRTPSR